MYIYIYIYIHKGSARWGPTGGPAQTRRGFERGSERFGARAEAEWRLRAGLDRFAAYHTILYRAPVPH